MCKYPVIIYIMYNQYIYIDIDIDMHVWLADGEVLITYLYILLVLWCDLS